MLKWEAPPRCVVARRRRRVLRVWHVLSVVVVVSCALWFGIIIGIWWLS
jgi:hypothetical protein